MSDFNITLFEACELLNRSKKSISRYIRRGLLHPQEVKSKQGTLEYRFSKADIEAFKAQEAQNAEETGQTRQDRTDQTGHIEAEKKTGFLKNQDFKGHTEETGHRRQSETGQDSEVITLLKETTGLLKGQLNKKDEQIKDLGNKIDGLIERDKENNYLIGQLQSKVFMLEKPKTEETDQTGQDSEKENKQNENGFTERHTEETGQDTGDETRQDKSEQGKETTEKEGNEAKEDENKEGEQKTSFWHKIFDF